MDFKDFKGHRNFKVLRVFRDFKVFRDFTGRWLQKKRVRRWRYPLGMGGELLNSPLYLVVLYGPVVDGRPGSMAGLPKPGGGVRRP